MEFIREILLCVIQSSTTWWGWTRRAPRSLIHLNRKLGLAGTPLPLPQADLIWNSPCCHHGHRTQSPWAVGQFTHSSCPLWISIWRDRLPCPPSLRNLDLNLVPGIKHSGLTPPPKERVIPTGSDGARAWTQSSASQSSVLSTPPRDAPTGCSLQGHNPRRKKGLWNPATGSPGLAESPDGSLLPLLT